MRCSTPVMELLAVVVLVVLVLLLPCYEALHTTKHLIDTDWSGLADAGNYTCDEMTRWLSMEKHYSNKNREVIFGLHQGDAQCRRQPALLLSDVKYGRPGRGSMQQHQGFFRAAVNSASKSTLTCAQEHTHVVAYLSNFSINNNFSHFLHGLLRMFCALVDAHWLVWDESEDRFVRTVDYVIWLDEYFKVDDGKRKWLQAMLGVRENDGDSTARIFHLGKDLPGGTCANAKTIVYGSGCVRLLPPEKWFGYPGCRAGDMLPAFGQYMRQQFNAPGVKELFFLDTEPNNVDVQRKARHRHHAVLAPPTAEGGGIKVAFAQRDVGKETGMRHISNLGATQSLLQRTQHVRTLMQNLTFEHLDVPQTVRYMAGVHIFVSVHGAGMTNMFFMNPGSAVVEIIPYPLCNCKSPDYFYGVGGYYHGSSVAQNIRHYPYCVGPQDQVWHKKPNDIKEGSKCSWRHLHAVESVSLDSSRFVSLMRSVERDLIQAGTVVLTQPIIKMSPHANG